LVVNTFERKMARQMDSANPVLGKRRVIELLDSGVNLQQILGIDIDALLPVTTSPERPLTLNHLLSNR
jgi:hypothetical protein